ncbi:M28 family metallopeptidase [Bryobacter aggregatus]|uniref:M28 family metallopeptidase n=1 Tax=Bryobacter aggregatus TaxID=360054 RepID=UPI0004E1043B|nr:M28 family metallopeptidase [Bryobacter aggregatus]
MKLRQMAAIATVGATLIAAERSTDINYAQEGKRWWSHVEVLAKDEMKGRNVGSPGFRAAAKYVAAEFEKAGLAPGASKSSYTQKVPFLERTIDESKSSLTLTRDGKAELLQLGEDANIGIRSAPAASVEAEMVFVGYGTKVPENNYDDFKGVDLKGKIAVFISGQPEGIPGPLASHYQSASERARFLAEAGAIGSATIANPRNSDIPWSRATLARLMPSMSIDEPGTGTDRLKVSLTINAAHADKFFAGSGHSIDELFALANQRQALPHFPLQGKLTVKAAYTQRKIEGENTIGIRYGTDPALRNEFIVISAHLDHLGVNDKISGDQIYNGAMDNASGVASLIEAARLIKEANLPLKRSIAFIALTGEEKGLLGSSWYAQHPVFGQEKKGRVVADLNMDMYLPLFPLKALLILGVDESTLGDLARKSAQDAGIEVWPDPAPERNTFIRSDQYSFIRNGIPALAFKFGYRKGTPEEKLVQAWLRDRYHSPADDLTQPVEKEAAAQYNRVLSSIITAAANAPETPKWKDASFFQRFAK